MRISTCVLGLGLVLSGHALAADAPPPAPIEKIPDTTMCGAKSPLENFTRVWYCGLLRRMNEPDAPIEKLGGTGRSYRLLWIRTHDPAAAVRVEVDWSGAAVLTAKLMSASDATARLVLEKSVSLGPIELRRVEQAFQNANFWTLPSEFHVSMGFGSRSTPIADKDVEILMDGSRWILEGLEAERYHLIGDNPLNHADSPPFVLGSVLLDLAHEKIPEFKIDPVY